MPRDSKRLGRGLDALIPGYSQRAGVREVGLDRIVPNPYQPRRQFDEESLAELAESIKVHGVVQPLILRESGEEQMELIAGERRWRAARMAGLTTVPAVVRQLDDGQMLQVALIENLQREDLNPIEEAHGFKSLMDEFKLTQDDLARAVGKSRSQVANTLRLLHLEPEVAALLERGQLTMGHAKVLLGVDGPELRLALAKQAARGAVTVRQLEQLASKGQATAGAGRGGATKVDTATRDLEAQMTRKLGTRVTVRRGGGKGKGRLEIEFFGLDDLHRILELCGLIDPL